MQLFLTTSRINNSNAAALVCESSYSWQIESVSILNVVTECYTEIEIPGYSRYSVWIAISCYLLVCWFLTEATYLLVRPFLFRYHWFNDCVISINGYHLFIFYPRELIRSASIAVSFYSSSTLYWISYYFSRNVITYATALYLITSISPC